MADINARDTKLIQYLNEAYGKEKELETALEAHIAMTTKAPYKKRLKEHLRETKGHAREVQRRIKQLGGKAEAGPISTGPDVITEAATGLTAVAGKAVAAAQGPLHAIRGTGEAEKMLKNARTEYHNEFAEIAVLRRHPVARGDGRRQGHRQARARHQARGGADGQVPREADRAAREGGRPRGDPGGRAERRVARDRRSSSRRSSSSSRAKSSFHARKGEFVPCEGGIDSSAKVKHDRAKSSSSRAQVRLTLGRSPAAAGRRPRRGRVK